MNKKYTDVTDTKNALVYWLWYLIGSLIVFKMKKIQFLFPYKAVHEVAVLSALNALPEHLR